MTFPRPGDPFHLDLDGTVVTGHYGKFLFVRTGAAGNLDGYRIGTDRTLTSVGSLTVGDATGAEGIAAA